MVSFMLPQFKIKIKKVMVLFELEGWGEPEKLKHFLPSVLQFCFSINKQKI